MTDFTISHNYIIINDSEGISQVHLTQVSIGVATSEVISETSTTSVSANGNINLDRGDTATLNFSLGNDDDWAIDSVQLMDEGHTNWGDRNGQALDDDEELDYPDVDQQTGTVSAPENSMRLSIRDANVRNKTVRYRVVFKNSQPFHDPLYSDPVIRDGGGGGTN